LAGINCSSNRGGTAIMFSDGSYKPLLLTKIGAAAWILECSQTSTVCFGECSTSGLWHEINAYWSELQGCHAGLLALLTFCIYHDQHSGSWFGQGGQGKSQSVYKVQAFELNLGYLSDSLQAMDWACGWSHFWESKGT
jgi:hypothetical protein